MKKLFRVLIYTALVASALLLASTSAALASIHRTVLEKPSNFQAEPDVTSIRVYFSYVENASSYKVRAYKRTNRRQVSVFTNVHSGDTLSGFSPMTRYVISIQAIGDGKIFKSSKESELLSVKTRELTCATGGSCSIGDVGPAGGKVFYVSVGGFAEPGAPCASDCHYLEAAPTTGTNAWSNSTKYAWAGTFAKLATGSAIGTGYANTYLMKAQDATGYAGAACVDYRGPNNFTDWFLPSRDETQELMLNYSIVDVPMYEQFWTSTDKDANGADIKMYWYDQVYTYFGSYKGSQTFLRPVRAF